MQLSQRKGFITTTYALEEHGILIRRKSMFNFSEFTLLYENISFQTSRSHSFRQDYTVTFLVAVFGSCIGLLNNPTEFKERVFIAVFGVVAIAFGILSVMSRRRLLRIEVFNLNATYLELREDEPSDQEVTQFTEALFNTIRSYLKEKYIDTDNNLSKEEQASRLRALYERNVLTKEEYDSLSFKMKYE